MSKGILMSIYDLNVTARDGSEVSLADYKGKVLLIVNTATGCGFTPHYEPLEAMYKEYRDQGFEILDFPCNQFADQAPGSDDEIHADPLFALLATEKPFEGFGKGLKNKALEKFAQANNSKFGEKAYIKWNFTKFLVDREGNIIARFEPTVDMDDVKKAVAAAL